MFKFFFCFSLIQKKCTFYGRQQSPLNYTCFIFYLLSISISNLQEKKINDRSHFSTGKLNTPKYPMDLEPTGSPFTSLQQVEEVLFELELIHLL